MKSGALYRLRTPTAGAVEDPGGTGRVPIMLPAGATLTVVDEDLGQTGYVRVHWEERIVTMFAIDLRGRGEKVDPAHP